MNFAKYAAHFHTEEQASCYEGSRHGDFRFYDGATVKPVKDKKDFSYNFLNMCCQSAFGYRDRKYHCLKKKREREIQEETAIKQNKTMERGNKRKRLKGPVRTLDFFLIWVFCLRRFTNITSLLKSNNSGSGSYFVTDTPTPCIAELVFSENISFHLN